MGIPPLDDRDVFELLTRTGLPLRLARLLLLVSRSVDAKMQLAIGGAVAAHDAGWQRSTRDLDVFARPVSARRLMKALAAQGASTFWITDAHGVAYLPEDNTAELAAREAPSVRVDVLSTVTEPGASAIRTAITPKMLGVAVKVFRPDHLTAIKFLAGRPKDLMDFDELILRGVDVERVRHLVATADAAKEAPVVARMRKLLKPSKPSGGVRDGRAQYLDRDAFNKAFAAALAASREPTGAR